MYSCINIICLIITAMSPSQRKTHAGHHHFLPHLHSVLLFMDCINPSVRLTLGEFSPPFCIVSPSARLTWASRWNSFISHLPCMFYLSIISSPPPAPGSTLTMFILFHPLTWASRWTIHFYLFNCSPLIHPTSQRQAHEPHAEPQFLFLLLIPSYITTPLSARLTLTLHYFSLSIISIWASRWEACIHLFYFY